MLWEQPKLLDFYTHAKPNAIPAYITQNYGTKCLWPSFPVKVILRYPWRWLANYPYQSITFTNTNQRTILGYQLSDFIVVFILWWRVGTEQQNLWWAVIGLLVQYLVAGGMSRLNSGANLNYWTGYLLDQFLFEPILRSHWFAAIQNYFKTAS